MRTYWFKPKRFWKWFAAYYPVTWEGWAVSLVTIALLAYAFLVVNADSHSASDSIVEVAKSTMATLLLFDVVTLRTGEYPSWWKKRG